jgi:hypothetical protein
MLSEIFAACVRASEAGDWDSVSDIIHQWHESAVVIEAPRPNPGAVLAQVETVSEIEV